jgi:hypothetical protein
MRQEFDAQAVRELLDELARRLEARGVRGTIRVAGGAAMLLHYPEDPAVRVTRDIDALIEPSDEIESVVAEMAIDLGLPIRWLNAAGRSSFKIEQRAPDADAPVAVSIASERELIAMKLSAARDKDFVDLGILARHLKITDPEELVRIAYDVYGDDAIELPDGRESYLWYAETVIAEAYRAKRRRRK